MNPGGEPERDDTGLPPVDIEIPDEQYQRCLSQLEERFPAAAELLAEIYCSVRPLLDASTPLFSKRLAEGLAFAENPKTGESFGMHRCRLVAEAICNAHARGVEGAEARLSEVKAVFAAAGLSLERPFLNAGSVDRYEFPLSRAA